MTKKKTIFKYVGYSLVILFILFLFKQIFPDRQETIQKIDLYGKYTIGTTSEIELSGRGKKWIHSFYYVNGQEYNATDDYNNEPIVCPNGRYFVKFLPDYPSHGYILTNKPVPDYIKEAPTLGWDTIPY